MDNHELKRDGVVGGMRQGTAQAPYIAAKYGNRTLVPTSLSADRTLAGSPCGTLRGGKKKLLSFSIIVNCILGVFICVFFFCIV